MAKLSFADQVGEFVAKSEDRMLAVFRQSAQDVVNEAQRARASGGNMPVRTGFLRNTGDMALNRLPVGETEPPEGTSVFSWDADAALVAIARAQLGDKIFFGWTANYAKYMEARYGFLRLAAQKWNDIVRENAQKLERLSGGND